MFKNDESPLSLFSFQDIITCLTGIMLFFLLIMSIQIIEITMRYEMESPHRAELEELKRRNDLLRRQMRDIERDAATYRSRLRKAHKEDVASLTMEKFRLERQLREKQLRQKEMAEKQKQLKQLKEDEEKRKAQLEKQLRELDEAIAKLEDLDRNNAELSEKIEKIRKEISDRRHKVEILVSGHTTKKPIVLECSKNMAVIRDLGTGNSEVVSRDDLSPEDFVRKIFRSAGTYSADDCYFAVLAKPDSAGYLSALRVFMRRSGYEFGIEPILESERCD